jgi:hypothetical protein
VFSVLIRKRFCRRGFRGVAGFRSTSFINSLRRSRGISGYFINNKDEAADIAKLKNCGRNTDGVNKPRKYLMSITNSLIFLRRRGLLMTQLSGQIENFFGSNLPRRLLSSAIKIIDAVSKAIKLKKSASNI